VVVICFGRYLVWDEILVAGHEGVGEATP